MQSYRFVCSSLCAVIAGITHSLCTLEFADHRPLYDWTIASVLPSGLLPLCTATRKPIQTEFSRLNLEYTVLSKRKLIQLVSNQHVTGWSDPRLPTISGLRRRGYPPGAIRLFCERVGISRAEGSIDMKVFEETMRDYLDGVAPRIFAVPEPLKVTITNWNAEQPIDYFNAENHPKMIELGSRKVAFDGHLMIDRADFFEVGAYNSLVPPKVYKRLLLNQTVRLKYAYVIRCDGVVRDPVTGDVVELLCSYDSATGGGIAPKEGKKPKGIIQWLSRAHAKRVTVCNYDRLFQVPHPGKNPEQDFLLELNNSSKTVANDVWIEQSIDSWPLGSAFQFERVGYYYLDPVSSRGGSSSGGSASIITKDRGDDSYCNDLVFNRIVTLKDTWQQRQ